MAPSTLSSRFCVSGRVCVCVCVRARLGFVCRPRHGVLLNVLFRCERWRNLTLLLVDLFPMAALGPGPVVRFRHRRSSPAKPKRRLVSRERTPTRPRTFHNVTVADCHRDCALSDQSHRPAEINIGFTGWRRPTKKATTTTRSPGPHNMAHSIVQHERFSSRRRASLGLIDNSTRKPTGRALAKFPVTQSRAAV